MKDKIFGVLQRVGRSFMLPIAILPVAGLLLGFGGSFTNETMLETYGLLNVMGPGTIPYAIFQVMSEAGNIVFANLPIIFAMGVAIGMAKKEKEVVYGNGTFSFLVNLIWILFFGWGMALGNIVLGCMWCITIVGIPFGKQFFKMARLSFMPFGANVL